MNHLEDQEGTLFIAQDNYRAESDQELSFMKNDIIVLISKETDEIGWWRGVKQESQKIGKFLSLLVVKSEFQLNELQLFSTYNESEHSNYSLRYLVSNLLPKTEYVYNQHSDRLQGNPRNYNIASHINKRTASIKAPTRSSSLAVSSIPVNESGSHNDDKGQCKICLDKKIDCVYVPCGHAVSCLECAGEYRNTTRKCPFCRAVSTSIIRLYYDC